MAWPLSRKRLTKGKQAPNIGLRQARWSARRRPERDCPAPPRARDFDQLALGHAQFGNNGFRRDVAQSDFFEGARRALAQGFKIEQRPRASAPIRAGCFRRRSCAAPAKAPDKSSRRRFCAHSSVRARRVELAVEQHFAVIGRVRARSKLSSAWICPRRFRPTNAKNLARRDFQINAVKR